MTSSTSVCRSCSAPITWGESANGKRVPFDPDGESHFKTCPDARTWSRQNGAQATSSTPSPTRDREIRRQVAAKCAATLLAAALQSRDDARLNHFSQIADQVYAWLEKGGTDA